LILKIKKYLYGQNVIRLKTSFLTTTINNSHFSASINHLGAELFSLKNTKTNIEYIWEGDKAFWPKHSPILFPIVGTLKNNTYHYNGTDYNLNRHGFARDTTFKLINKTENSALFSLESSSDSLAVYPFNFELQIQYTLEATGLHISYFVKNTSVTNLPFSIGAHPAFALSGQFEDYALAFEKEEILSYNLLENDLIADTAVNLIAVDKIVPLHYELFKNDALIFRKLKSKAITILKNKVPYLKLQFATFPHLGIWTKVDAPFLCIEPWHGYSDTINSTGDLFEKEGIEILEPNTRFQTNFSIEIL
jgi:galactose mutarotase-like enzyme